VINSKKQQTSVIGNQTIVLQPYVSATSYLYGMERETITLKRLMQY
jgi:hypothetical protein